MKRTHQGQIDTVVDRNQIAASIGFPDNNVDITILIDITKCDALTNIGLGRERETLEI